MPINSNSLRGPTLSCLGFLPLLACMEVASVTVGTKRSELEVASVTNVTKGSGPEGDAVTIVRQVKASNSNGYFKAWNTLVLEVTFSSPWNLAQGMQATFPLELLTRQAEAVYQSGSGSDVWRFTYSVLTGDNTSSYLQYPSGAKIRIAAVDAPIDSQVLMDLPDIQDAGSLGNQSQLIIDTKAPDHPKNLLFQKNADDDKAIQLFWDPATDDTAAYNARLCRASDCQSDCTAAVAIDSHPFSIRAPDDTAWKTCLQSIDKAGNVSDWVLASALAPPTGIAFSSGLYLSPAVTVSWDRNPSAESYAYKICSNATCSIDCSSEQVTSSTSITGNFSDKGSAYACIAAIHKSGMRSVFGVSAQSTVIDALPPIINIGPNRSAGNSFVLTPTITEASAASYAWSKVSGPGTVTFESPNAASTLIDATTEGVYEISLKVTDAQGRSTEASFQLNWERSLALSAFRNNICGIFPRGRLKCWGTHLDYRNATGTADVFSHTAPPSTPIDVGPSRSVLSVSIGAVHLCALLDNGSVKCWGDGSEGQLGNGDLGRLSLPSSEPVDLGPGRSAVAVGAGARHTCALLDNGTVKCWGYGGGGQLGIGDMTNRSTPANAVDLGASFKAKALAVGTWHTCVILDNDTVKCWGGWGSGQAMEVLTPTSVTFPGVQQVKKLRTGWDYSCAIMSDDSVYCWGKNRSGRLGDTTTTDRPGPVPHTALAGVTKDLSLGDDFTCALFLDNTVRCWGTAATVIGADRQNFATLCSDGISATSHKCTSSGGVWNNHFGDCSNGQSTSPSACLAVGGTWASCSDFTKISSETCVGGSLLWDTNRYGYCSNGTANASAFCTAKGGTMAATGYCADKTHLNRVSCLAAGKTWYNNLSPGPSLDFGAGRSVLALVAAPVAPYACALLDNMGVKCWGDNSVGALGYGDSYYSRSFSAPLNLGATALKVVSGLDFKCALLSGGSVKCWGANAMGQLGIGNYADHYTPPAAPITLAAPAVDIASHHYHSCALLNNNTVQCWGFNNVGQLGNGSIGGQMPSPVTVTGLTDTPTAVSVGREHTCILLSAGNVKCWGLVHRGSIGAGVATPANLCSDGVTANTSCTGSLVWSSNLHGDCSNGLSTSEAACEARPNGIWAHCSDGIKPTADSCVGGTLVWDTSKYGYCTSRAVTTKPASTFCTDNGGSWHSSIGYCSNATYKSRLSCLNAGGSWHLSVGPGADVDLGGVAATQIFSSGEYSVCALLNGGALRCWGLNNAGQIGSDDSSGATYFTPGPAVNFGAHAIKTLTSGQNSFCAILSDDSMRCWGGSNSSFEFGYGDNVSNHYKPAAISADFGSGRSVRYVSQTTANSRCIIASDNTVRCLGSLGINYVSGNQRTSPLDLGTTIQPSQVVLTGNSICVTFIDGSVRCAGDNSIGQGGSTLPTYRYLPAATVAFYLN